MSLPPDTPRVRSQLEAIAILSATLEQHAIDYWVFGGWAVDFWVGCVTRAHEDVDVAARRADSDAIRAALVGAGWRHVPTQDEAEGTVYDWHGVKTEFTFVSADDEKVVLLLAGEPVVWSTKPFGNDRRQLNGVECRVIPLGVLRSGKRVAREGEADGAKDRADYKRLSGKT